MAMNGRRATQSNEFLLAEYEALRQETVKRIDLQQQMATIALTAVSAFFLVGSQGETVGQLALLYPPMALLFSTAWLHHHMRIMELGDYVKGIEDKLNVQGWEHRTELTTERDKLKCLVSVTSVNGVFLASQLASLGFGLASWKPEGFAGGTWLLWPLVAIDLLAALATYLVLRYSFRLALQDPEPTPIEWRASVGGAMRCYRMLRQRMRRGGGGRVSRPTEDVAEASPA